MTEPIKWHEPENSNEYITDEYIERAKKMYNPVEFRQLYLNEAHLNLPQKPEELIGALQDPVHQDIGRSRPAKAIKSRKIL